MYTHVSIKSSHVLSSCIHTYYDIYTLPLLESSPCLYTTLEIVYILSHYVHAVQEDKGTHEDIHFTRIQPPRHLHVHSFIHLYTCDGILLTWPDLAKR